MFCDLGPGGVCVFVSLLRLYVACLFVDLFHFSFIIAKCNKFLLRAVMCVITILSLASLLSVHLVFWKCCVHLLLVR